MIANKFYRDYGFKWNLQVSALSNEQVSVWKPHTDTRSTLQPIEFHTLLFSLLSYSEVSWLTSHPPCVYNSSVGSSSKGVCSLRDAVTTFAFLGPHAKRKEFFSALRSLNYGENEAMIHDLKVQNGRNWRQVSVDIPWYLHMRIRPDRELQ